MTKNDDEALLYLDLREASLADMYELLCRRERRMHTYIRVKIEETSGPKAFWRQLPRKVRNECKEMKESDDRPESDPYAYTTFIHLREIFEKKWAELSDGLPNRLSQNKKEFLSLLARLNSIRNKVMHPVRNYRPSREDFKFVSDFAVTISDEKRNYAAAATGAP